MPTFDELRLRLVDSERAAQDARGRARSARVRAAAPDQDEQTGEATAKAAAEAGRRAQAVDRERLAALDDFLVFTDPRHHVERLPDETPILLMPVRLETRFGVGTDEQTGAERPELWVRIYPDDCSVTAFDAELSVGEVTAGTRFWQEWWRAGGVDAESRAAWRNLAGGYGVGRAGWIVETFTPVNPADRPVKSPATDVVLVVSTDVLPAEPLRTELATYWTSVWVAGDDQTQLAAARSALVAAVGSASAAQDAVDRYTPFNLRDPPPPDHIRSTTHVVVAWLQLPAEPGEERLGWRSAPTARALPERFVLTLYPTGGVPFDAIGGLVTEPLYVGPDPLGDPIMPDAGKLKVPDELAWMFDFDRAVAAGVGIKVPLSQAQAARGFDRIVALGVRMRSDAEAGRLELEELLSEHAWSRSGFELLGQGVATNNADGAATGWSRRNDPDLAYDEVFGPEKFHVETDPLDKRDGQLFAERLGLDPAALTHVRGADGRDGLEALAMNAALAPGTLNYLTGTVMTPVFDGWEGEISWFFTSCVTGRGPIPAVRLGAQPYGVIASTALSRISWLDRQPRGLEVPRRRWSFLQRLHGVLVNLEPIWRAQLGQVSHVASGAADPHQTLLGAVGLHPNSAEFHIRHGKHLDELVSRGGFLFLNLLLLLAATEQRQQALAMLRGMGYEGREPDLLDLFFKTAPTSLVGPLIEAVPLSETVGLQPSTTTGDNYLEWLADAAASSLDALRTQEGFKDDTPPQTLLFIMLQFALTRGYLDASDRLRLLSGLWAAEALLDVRREPTSVHVHTPISGSASESPWLRLYGTDARLTGSATTTIAEHLTAVLPDRPDYVVDLAEQIRAVQLLRDTPTARLERLLVEHIDTLTYRYDAWRLGLVTWQLDRMRALKGAGVYLGSYGWLEDVRPKPRPTPAPDLPSDVAPTFADDLPLVIDPTNGGHLHAPSLNQAVTAAVLRAGELANRTPGAPGAFSINLSSERVREATALLEGVRTGQSLGALLGYRFERAMHDLGGVIELDALVFAFRRAFPLTADRVKDTESSSQNPPPPASEAIEARNVTDGLALVNRAGTSDSYPYGAELPALGTTERAAVEKIVRDLAGTFDALADLVLAESVHQSSQSNPERAGAQVDLQGDFTAPPDADVVRTPTRGWALTSRVGIELDTTATAVPTDSPRARAQPMVDHWLAHALPPLSKIGCTATWKVPGVTPDPSLVVTMADLGLRPLDVLELISDEGGADLAELEDRVRRHVISVVDPRADRRLHIRHMDGGPGNVSVFVASAMVRRLRGLVLQSRPLRAGDVMPPSRASAADAVPHEVARTRLSSVVSELTTLRDVDLEGAIAAGKTALDDPVTHRAAMISGIDARIIEVADLLAHVALFGGARTGWGSLYDWRADLFTDLLTRTTELLDRWQLRSDACVQVLSDELAPGLTDEARLGLLRAAEGQVSTSLAPELDPLALRPVVETKQTAFVTKLTDIRTDVIDAPNSSLADRLARCAGVLPLSDFDPQPFGYTDLEDLVVEYWADLQALLTSARTDVDKRIEAAGKALLAHDAATDAPGRLAALQQGAEEVFGEGFRLVPTFTLPTVDGAEQTQAHQHFTSGGLLAKAAIAIGVDNPLDTWLYGAARVRTKVRQVEDLVMLWEAYGLAPGALAVAQLPHKAGAPWLALDFPKEDAPDGERMSYVALVGTAYDPAAQRCGLLVDEWAETIPAVEPDEPGPQHETGVAFHFDRPSQEPPQAMLLLTPATWDGAWQWSDIVDGVVDTFDLARLRAVEPDQLADTSLAQFLPATLASVTTSGLLLSANFALANTNAVVKRSLDG